MTSRCPAGNGHSGYVPYDLQSCYQAFFDTKSRPQFANNIAPALVVPVMGEYQPKSRFGLSKKAERFLKHP